MRFFDRRKWNKILSNRRSHRQKVLVVGENLTYANYQVSNKAMEHSATFAAWSSNRKIMAKVKNGPSVRLNIHTGIDEAFRRAMSSSEMSTDKDNSSKSQQFLWKTVKESMAEPLTPPLHEAPGVQGRRCSHPPVRCRDLGSLY